MYVEAMQQHGADWYYNSQATPDAVRALNALQKKGLAEVHWKGEEGGVHIVRPTPKEAEGVLFNKGGTAPAAGQGAEAISQAEIIQTQEALLGGPRYIEKRVPYDPSANAAALTREGGIVTSKGSAQDARIDLEERVHLLSKDFDANPAVIGKEVSDGFMKFNADAGRPLPLSKRAMMEGLAQYVVRRTAGELQNLTPEQWYQGLIEIIGEFAKIASLSFRLFGNVFAGEVLLASMAAIFAYAIPVPFLFLEILVGVIQALIFSILLVVYFTISATDHDEHGHEEEHKVAHVPI